MGIESKTEYISKFWSMHSKSKNMAGLRDRFFHYCDDIVSNKRVVIIDISKSLEFSCMQTDIDYSVYRTFHIDTTEISQGSI